MSFEVFLVRVCAHSAVKREEDERERAGMADRGLRGDEEGRDLPGEADTGSEAVRE